MNKGSAIVLAAALLVGLVFVTGVLAQGTASIDWWVVAGGGGPAVPAGLLGDLAPPNRTAAHGVSLNTTLGQPIIGPSAVPSGLLRDLTLPNRAAGDSATLGAGYWYGAAAVENKIYLPVVLRSYGP